MKTLVLILLSLSFLNASAAEETLPFFACTWLESKDQPVGYFQENAGFEIYMKDDAVYILDKGFFNRSYSPCWAGGFSSCSFGFEYNKDEPWEFSEIEGGFRLSQNWLYTAELDFVFSKTRDDLLTVRGEDGDGVFVNESFKCSAPLLDSLF